MGTRSSILGSGTPGGSAEMQSQPSLERQAIPEVHIVRGAGEVSLVGGAEAGLVDESPASRLHVRQQASDFFALALAKPAVEDRRRIGFAQTIDHVAGEQAAQCVAENDLLGSSGKCLL